MPPGARVLEERYEQLSPGLFDAVLRGSTELHPVATDVDTGEAVDLHAGIRDPVTLRLALRAYDSIGRFGGEEFLIVLPGCDTDAAVVVAERARVNVAAPLEVAGVVLPMSVSLGVGAGHTSMTADGLIQAADDALYRAKASGRNRVSV